VVLRRLTDRLGGKTAPTGARSKLELLQEADLFRDLAPADMEEIERTTTMVTCPRGRVVFEPGETPEALFVLKRGRVQLYRLTEDGRRLVMGIAGAGSVFGEMPLLSQKMSDSFAEAVEDSTICVMSRSDVERLIAAKPRLALNVVRHLAGRVQELEGRLEAQTYRAVPERLAGALIRLAAGGREVAASHQEIGDLIGASRETVTRALGELRAAGLVELGRSRIEIRDASGLRRLAGEGDGGG
jgi:CRP/FNR family transcriptional regulator